jgi:PST family polysaccharide transporter
VNLLHTGVLTTVATLVRLSTAFIVNKVVAITIGPAGLAVLGQVQNATSILQNLSAGIFGTAVVKQAAHLKNDREGREAFLRLVFTVTLGLSVVAGSGTIILAGWISRWLIGDASHAWVFIILGLCLPGFAISTLVLSAVNGAGDVSSLTRMNIAQSILGLCIAAGLPLWFGLDGAMAGAAMTGVVALLAVAMEVRRHAWLKFVRIRWRADKVELRRVGRFATMAIASGICAPVAQILVRQWIATRCSAAEAGQWQGIVRFSGAYSIFFTAILGVYCVPRFAQLGAQGLGTELRSIYTKLLPVAALAFGGIWLTRDLSIPWLFSPEFAPMKNILGLQLTGDFLRLGGWVLGALILAREQTLAFVATEIGFNALYVATSFWLVGSDGAGGARGAVAAWALLYALYWPVLALLCRGVVRRGVPGRAANPSNDAT